MNNFVSKRHVVSANQNLKAKPSDVFPLLCPKREYDWIPGWNCDIIYSKSGFAEQDCIFNTHFPNDCFETWVTDKYIPNQEIQFIRVSEERVIRYSIQLTENTDGTTRACWEQTITSLNQKGNSYIEKFDDNAFFLKIKHLEKLLNHFLEIGQMMKI
jgi:hypothetical protein